jgi:hypothetical protein
MEQIDLGIYNKVSAITTEQVCVLSWVQTKQATITKLMQIANQRATT